MILTDIIIGNVEVVLRSCMYMMYCVKIYPKNGHQNYRAELQVDETSVLVGGTWKRK